MSMHDKDRDSSDLLLRLPSMSSPFRNRPTAILCLTLFVAAAIAPLAAGQSAESQFRTNWQKSSVDLREIMSGGVPKDGIPPIDNPKFVSTKGGAAWVGAREPVIMLVVEGDARAYPLQIMTYHEIVNDEVGGVPVTVTFCPLCYSAIVYRRTVDSVMYDFGVSGMLRYSDLIMYDRQTESLWQQIDGEAIVGDLTGTRLDPVPAQIVSFEQFAERYPGGKVLSRDTGFIKPYGTNPYAGYDDISERPFLFRGEYDKRLPPMVKVVTVSIGGVDKAYPHSATRKEKVINDEVGGRSIVVFHTDGAVTALGDKIIRRAEEIGTTGVFDRRNRERILTFEYDGAIRDRETGSVWDVTGRAISGPLTGMQLEPITHGNYFSFAWFAFKPDTRLYSAPE